LCYMNKLFFFLVIRSIHIVFVFISMKYV
jgi:hypothetical protein